MTWEKLSVSIQLCHNYFTSSKNTLPKTNNKIMNPLVVLALCVAGAVGNPYGAAVRTDSSYGYGSMSSADSAKVIPIVSMTNDIRGSQSSNLNFQTGNGIQVSDNTQAVAGGGMYEDENGQMVKSETTLTKSGSYSYTSPDGTPITVNWSADDKGFHATGAHLPQPVEMPAELKAAYQEALSRVAPASSGSYGYAAPAVKSSYEAPAIRSSYEAPVVRSTYEAPAIRMDSYSAPAPAIRIESYSSGY